MFIVSVPFLIVEVLSGNEEIMTGIELPDTLDECRLGCLIGDLGDHKLVSLTWRESVGIVLLEVVSHEKTYLENRNVDPIVIVTGVDTSVVGECLSFSCKISFHVIEDTLFEVLRNGVHCKK